MAVEFVPVGGLQILDDEGRIPELLALVFNGRQLPLRRLPIVRSNGLVRKLDHSQINVELRYEWAEVGEAPNRGELIECNHNLFPSRVLKLINRSVRRRSLQTHSVEILPVVLL